jgi:hypothetical protein
MNCKTICVVAALCAFPAVALANPVWVPSNGTHCAEVCNDQNLFPVASGKFGKNSYYVCAANKGNQGFRGGWNLTDFGKTCVAAIGTDNTAGMTEFNCLCHTKRVSGPE